MVAHRVTPFAKGIGHPSWGLQVPFGPCMFIRRGDALDWTPVHPSDLSEQSLDSIHNMICIDLLNMIDVLPDFIRAVADLDGRNLPHALAITAGPIVLYPSVHALLPE
jgi:hypothetical protein